MLVTSVPSEGLVAELPFSKLRLECTTPTPDPPKYPEPASYCVSEETARARVLTCASDFATSAPRIPHPSLGSKIKLFYLKIIGPNSLTRLQKSSSCHPPKCQQFSKSGKRVAPQHFTEKWNSPKTRSSSVLNMAPSQQLSRNQSGGHLAETSAHQSAGQARPGQGCLASSTQHGNLEYKEMSTLLPLKTTTPSLCFTEPH